MAMQCKKAYKHLKTEARIMQEIYNASVIFAFSWTIWQFLCKMMNVNPASGVLAAGLFFFFLLSCLALSRSCIKQCYQLMFCTQWATLGDSHLYLELHYSKLSFI